ncbi:MAG: hypothetical protein NTU91_14870 [Chloroflexi bacterium]|jgi:hypothetical protein|nr:hypothetical protein [Chloroflexota bacterium]
MPDSMTGCERFFASLERHKPDRVPIFELFIDPRVIEALTPRPVLAPQMLFRYLGGPITEFYDAWLYAGAPHHMALAYGHLGSTIARLGSLAGIEVASV